MGRSPCCETAHTNKGAWTKQEDDRLIAHIRAQGESGWRSLPKAAGLLRCGKSCRLRWMNYLRPGLKRGDFSEEEDDLIIKLHCLLGNKWSLIAGRLPGRTDNEIKNYWNTHIKRKLMSSGLDPRTHRPLCPPHNSNTTLSSPPAPKTVEIATVFQYERSESSTVEPAASKAKKRPDLDLDLCMSLPFHSPPAGNSGSRDEAPRLHAESTDTNYSVWREGYAESTDTNYSVWREGWDESSINNQGDTCD